MIESAGVPAGYYRGMFQSNPLNEIVGDDPARDQLIDALVENAYEAASIEVDRESAQRGGVILGAMAQGVLAGKQGQDAFAAFDGAVAGLFPPCFKATWYTTPSAWSVPPANAGWILYEQEDAHGACFACRYSRIYTISRTRTATHRHNDCSYTVCNQVQTKTIEDRGFVACIWASCPQVFSGTPTITETKTWLNQWTPPCP